MFGTDDTLFIVSTDGCGNLIAADPEGKWSTSVRVLDRDNDEVTMADFVMVAQAAWRAMDALA